MGCAGSAEVPAVDSTDGKSGSGISRCVLMHPARVSASRGERICLSFMAASKVNSEFVIRNAELLCRCRGGIPIVCIIIIVREADTEIPNYEFRIPH